MSLGKRSRDSQETLHARPPFNCDADVVKLARESAVVTSSCSLFLAQLFSAHDAHLSAPATVDRMARVQRPPIQADTGAETVRLDKPLRGVVATLAQALERTKPEFVHVAMMWLDVIADCRWCDDGALQAILTKRVFEQLVPPDASPASRGIPLVPLRRSAANAHGSTYHPDRCTKHRAVRYVGRTGVRIRIRCTRR